MNLFLVTYDLIAPDKDYQSLYEAIQSYGSCAHMLESVWIIKSSSTSKDIRDHLESFLDNNDKMFVVEINRWASKNLPKEITNWLKEN